jgi:hypothetical protein
MRFPLTHTQATILVKLINNEKLLKRDMMILDMVILTQVGAIKLAKEENNNNGLTITLAGKRRFVKWARKEGMVA